jgi:DNA-binding transcriptional regulator YiaG
MTPAEFKHARHTLGLTIAETAHILAVGPRTVRGWEQLSGSRSRDPSPTACRVMEWMLNGYRPPEWTQLKGMKK